MTLLRIAWITIGVIFVVIIIEIIFEIYLENNYDRTKIFQEYADFSTKDYNTLLKEIEDPIVLWWSELVPERSEPVKCGNVSCFFTHNRKFKGNPLQKAIIFYGSDMHVLDLPLPRNRGQTVWALFHEESPKNFLPLVFDKTLFMFDLSATFSRHSHLPLTLQYLEDAEALQTMKYFIPFEEKDMLTRVIAPMLYIQSSCYVPSDRDSYVKELMKYIKVDSYGECLNNKKLPEDIRDPATNLMSDKFLHFIARYKFMIAFENAICDDYITEKLWRSLMVGSIPIYYGSPTILDWLPNKKSAILVTDFDTPQALSAHLHKVMNNRTEYNSYLDHKLANNSETKISNLHLKNALKERLWKVNHEADGPYHIQHFECMVCHEVHSRLGSRESNFPQRTISQNHFWCENPVSSVDRKRKSENGWHSEWRTAKCESEVMGALVESKSVNYSKSEFDRLLEYYFHNKIC